MIKSLKTKIAAPVAALAAAIAFTAVAPSIAQARPYDRFETISYRDSYDFRGLQQRVNQGVRSGELNRREANRLNWQIDNLRDRADSYSRGGFNRAERRDLDMRYQQLSAQVYREKHDNDYRGRNWR